MSLIKLIKNVNSATKTNILLNDETSKLLRFTFAESIDHPINSSIIDSAVALQLGEDLIYKKKYRDILIESLRSIELKSLGYENSEDAKSDFDTDFDKFFRIFKIEETYRKLITEDDRESNELILPKHGDLIKINAFPHDYQKRLKKQITLKLFNGFRPAILATMPTGGGKTVLALETVVDIFRVEEELKNKTMHLLWIVDSKELCEQSLQSFKKIWLQRGDHPLLIQRYFDKFNKIEINENISSITFATFDLITSRITNTDIADFISKISLMIIDEAHSSNASTYREVFEKYKDFNPDYRILGLTATPYRNDDNINDSLRNMFNEVISITNDNNESEISPIDFLTNKGYLAKINFQLLKNEESNIKTMNYYKTLHLSVIENCKRLIENKHNTIIFAESKSHAIALSILLTKNDIKNGLIVGETPNIIRKDLIQKFGDKENELQVLINHQILSTGIDVPGMNSIMILGEINSPTLALQIIGRAMRGHKNGGNEVNTIYLTSKNRKKLEDFKLLEYIVLNN
jgi:DNA repair protein RadD